MAGHSDLVRVEILVPLEPASAFDALVDEMTLALADVGLHFEPGMAGRVLEAGTSVGRVTEWHPPDRVRLEWHPTTWEPTNVTEVELSFEAATTGTRVRLEHRGFGRLLGTAGEPAGWFAGQVAAPLMRSFAPRAFGDWITDRRARRPTGAQARAMYRDPLYHRPNFRAILAAVALMPGDYLLEVGCGGGAFLADALRSGCRAAAIDHSPDMVRLAREVNRAAIAAGRVTIQQASAEQLPFDDGTFTAAVMTGVFGFIADPVAALAEIRRALRDDGRLIVMGTDPRWRGTPAAPEPMASRLHFYDDREMEAIAREAGFVHSRVERIPLDAYAREAGVPEEALPLFGGDGAPFLIARKAQPEGVR